jgi:hypothetical protein
MAGSVADPHSWRAVAMRSNRWRIDAAAFADVRIICGLDVGRAARLLHVAPRTVRRWESGRCRVPYAAFRLLRLMAAGRVLCGPWREFSVRGETLWTPEGKAFKAHELAYLWLTFAMARRWQADYAARGALDRSLQGLPPAALSGNMRPGVRAAGGSAANVCGAHAPASPAAFEPSRLSPRAVTRGENNSSIANQQVTNCALRQDDIILISSRHKEGSQW